MKVAWRGGSILFGPEFSYAVARRWALNLFNQERAARVNINAKRKKQAGAILSAQGPLFLIWDCLGREGLRPGGTPSNGRARMAADSIS